MGDRDVEYVFHVRALLPNERSGDLAARFAQRLAVAAERLLDEIEREDAPSLYRLLAEPGPAVDRGPPRVAVESLIPLADA